MKHLVVQETKHTAVVVLEPELVAQMDRAAGIIDGDSGVLTSQ